MLIFVGINIFIYTHTYLCVCVCIFKKREQEVDGNLGTVRPGLCLIAGSSSVLNQR